MDSPLDGVHKKANLSDNLNFFRFCPFGLIKRIVSSGAKSQSSRFKLDARVPVFIILKIMSDILRNVLKSAICIGCARRI